MSDQEYGYQCRRCGAGTAYGTMISDGGQVKLWCLSCLRDALEAAPHAPSGSAEHKAQSTKPDNEKVPL
jgi:hypothetical protein